MTKDDVLLWLEDQLAGLDERETGNAIYPMIAARLHPMVSPHRAAIVEALRQLLSFRRVPSEFTDDDALPEARQWLALSVAADLRLAELRQDIAALLSDLRAGKTLLPVYEEMVRTFLATLDSP